MRATACGDVAGDRRAHQPFGHVGRQRRQPDDLVECHQRCVGPDSPVLEALREHHADTGRGESTQRELERLAAGRADPLHVVDDHRHRPPRCHLRVDQFDQRHADVVCEGRLLIGVPSSEHHLEGVPSSNAELIESQVA
ncbi:MAG: hypothetical protein R2713_04055 [Ilumatobacteraceae bacterium]